ncbi:MAG: hypothetical protein LWX83_14055 [Anaerolineae bacterium]|nr:hypothetical protein [Anaerolineae bacterium]
MEKNTPLQKFTRGLPFLLGLSALEGFFAIIFIFQTPSMDKNVWMFGLSLQRIISGGLASVPVLLVLILALITASNRTVKNRWGEYLYNWLHQGQCLATFSVMLIGLFFAGCYLFYLFNRPDAIILVPLPFIFERIQSMIVWAMLFCLQVLVLLFYSHPASYPAILWNANTLKVFAFMLAGWFILAHWIILIFRLDLLISIPGWFWQFHEKTFGLNDLLFIPMLVLMAAAIGWVLKHPERTWLNLLVLILTGYVFQAGFGYIQGDGFESLRLKYATSSHVIYAQHASDQPDLFKAISEYENYYGQNGYVQTKPPGMLTFYILTQKVSAIFFPDHTFNERLLGLTTFASFVYPLISFLTLIPMFFLARLLLGQRNAFLACIFYLSSPLIMLMPLFLDQVLFPLLFISTACLMVFAFERQSLLLAFLSGILLYISVFCSFSLVALLPLAAALGFFFFLQRGKTEFKTILRLGLGFLGGVILFYVLFLLFLNYDPIVRFVHAMSTHYRDDFFNRFGVSAQNSYLPSLDQRLSVLYVNVLSYALWIGLPLFFLVLSGGLRFIITAWKERDLSVTLYSMAMLLTMFALLVSGEGAGEVARQWAFITTFFCIFASREIRSLFKNRKDWITILLIIQFVTMFITFKFQDFVT